MDYSGLLGEGSIPVPLPPPLPQGTQFLHRGTGPKSPIKGMLFEPATVLEIAGLQHFGLGDSIFLQGFVLRHFSIVQKDQVPER
jgi:hypothetical protein